MGYTDILYKLKHVGENVHISSNAYIRYPELVEIGNNVVIDEFVHITTALKMNDFIHIGPHVSIIGGRNSQLIMEDFSGLMAGARIVCTTDDLSGKNLTSITIPTKFRPDATHSVVKIGRHGIVGTNSVVLPGVEIGDGSVIGTMSLAIKNVPAWGIYFGIPVRKIDNRDKKTLLLEEENFKKYSTEPKS